MPSTLYIEPFSGVAGDMLLSALCGLADAYDDILALPSLLHLPDARIEIQTLRKNGISCRHVKITESPQPSQPSQKLPSNSPYLPASAPSLSPSLPNHSPHRHLADILALIEAAQIPARAKTIAAQIFTLIGEAEARIHDIPLQTIHFHEVSGVDSIIDIVGCALLIDRLDIAATYCDPICVGYGQVKTQHGLLPVPAPATAELLLGMPTFKGDEPGERATPTGAAILRYLQPRFETPPAPAAKIAYGPGQKDFRSANVVRLSLLQAAAGPRSDRVHVLQTNIDDMSPELLGDAFQRGLLAAGALDFHLAPVQMKKGRPGLLLSALAREDARDALIDYILENTSSIGVRHHPAERRVLERRKISVDTPFGTLLAKETIKPSGARSRKFEHDSLLETAARHGITVHQLLGKLAAHQPNPL